MLLDKSQLPVVAVQSMNQTHDDEVDIINKLFDLITRQRAGEPVEQELKIAVDQFADHVEKHFSSEEKLMEQVGFPAFSVHKSEHDRVRVELFSIIEVWKETNILQPLADYLENIHPNWAKNHIATMDTMTAYFIVQSEKVDLEPVGIS